MHMPWPVPSTRDNQHLVTLKKKTGTEDEVSCKVKLGLGLISTKQIIDIHLINSAVSICILSCNISSLIVLSVTILYYLIINTSTMFY